jgi:hypothetical protein
MADAKRRKAKPKTRVIPMLVRVRVPASMSAAAARREVRTRIADLCAWDADLGDVKVAAVSPVPLWTVRHDR